MCLKGTIFLAKDQIRGMERKNGREREGSKGYETRRKDRIKERIGKKRNIRSGKEKIGEGKGNQREKSEKEGREWTEQKRKGKDRRDKER